MGDLWGLIKDLIGPLNEWPRYMPTLFFKRGLNQKDRFKLCCFVWVNGLPPNIFFEWGARNHLFRDNEAWSHVRYLFRKFESGEWGHKYWQWKCGHAV